jgi:Cu+-exporting ATPase
MKSDLQDVVTAIRLSKAVIRNIKQNLFWAFFYNSVGIPLAAGVLYPLFSIQLSPMFAAAAMSLSSVCVVSNALRLKRFKAQPLPTTQPVAAAPSIDAQRCGALPVDSTVPAQTDGQRPITKEDSAMRTVTIHIEGMSCGHCSAHVEKALNALEGVSAKVDLAAKQAVCTVSSAITDDQLAQAVTDAGYTVVGMG